MAKFSSRAWCLPRDEFIGVGQLWFARLWLSGSPQGGFRFVFTCACIYRYNFIYMYLDVHPPARDALVQRLQAACPSGR